MVVFLKCKLRYPAPGRWLGMKIPGPFLPQVNRIRISLEKNESSQLGLHIGLKKMAPKGFKYAARISSHCRRNSGTDLYTTQVTYMQLKFVLWESRGENIISHCGGGE